jgi:subtilase family serine protease
VLALASATAGAFVVSASATARPELLVASRLPLGATPLGALPPTRRLAIDVVLRPVDAAALASTIAAVTTPGSASYRHYLTAAQFAARFGADSSEIALVDATLAGAGFHRLTVATDHLVLGFSATAAQVERAFSTTISRVRLASGTVGFANTTAIHVPAPLSGLVSSITGLDSLDTPAPADLQVVARAAHPTAALGGAPARVVAHGVPTATGSCAATIASLGSAITTTSLATAYGYTNVYATGDLGAGATVALIEFAPYVASDVATYDSCFGISSPVSAETVDGGSQASSSGEVEADLDVEDVQGLAPLATVVAYEGSDASDTGVLDTYTAAVDNPAVSVISTSWGGCEAGSDANLLTGEATVLEQAVVLGKSVVAASGDSGSEDCYEALRGAAGRALAVDDPASQPDVTGVGGTTISAIGPRPTETVWNSGGGGGGGGVSSVWAMPAYQSEAPAALGVVNSHSSCPSAAGDCREVPDVSADAGNPVAFYTPASGRGGGSSWSGVEGTSVAAPTWAALFALADESVACGGTALGFANPALYAVAGGSGYASAFNDITSGDNDVLGTNGGLYPAGPGYDLASGLGTPNAGSGEPGDSGLVTQLCDQPRAAGAGTEVPAGQAVPTTTTTTSTTTTTTTLPPPVVTATTLGPTGTTAAALSVRTLSPAAGPLAGHNRVTIVGTGLGHATSVLFGTKRATALRVLSATRLSVLAPPGTGTVSVVVVTPAGRTAAASGARYRYLAVPSLTALHPATGKAGTKVTLVGSDLIDVSAVVFGSTKAAAFTVESADEIVAVAPAGAGHAEVVAVTPGGRSPAVAAVTFSYTAS